MIITLVGYRKVEYKNKDGKDIKGVEVHGVFMDSADENYEGSPCFIQYMGGIDADSLAVGEAYSLNVEITMFGGKPTARITGLTPVGDIEALENEK